eukprot:TRINITY_DN6244_c0_g1_i1.p1 TRINITY_DN6244_c0_g1~~TRINITY_DN6244_c0_g1_i1.p1  ORF type:complete len:231 (+),score=29.61 TRINITY_DN6244_c0_g1_i1:291-983(+)
MPPTLRVLCLHGYAQSGSALRAKSGALRSDSKKLAAFVFSEAPHVLTAAALDARRKATGREEVPGPASDPCDDPPRTWYHFSTEQPLCDRESLEHSVEALRELCCSEGPFDALLGFSQGASMVALLAGRKVQGQLPPEITFNFVALFSGFAPRDPGLLAELEAAAPRLAEIPSFHCYGATDEIITSSESQKVASLFGERAVHIEHDGGHYIPSSKPVRQAFKAFLKDRCA